MGTDKRTITLYDAGGLIIGVVLLGIPFGVIFDYFWNMVVLSVAWPRIVGRSMGVRIGCGRQIVYCLFITALGVVIDWAYFELTWDTDFGKSAVWAPAMSMPLQLLLLLLPMTMLAMVNFAISYSFLKLERRPAITLGAVMGIFTAPWLLPIVPYVAGWVK